MIGVNNTLTEYVEGEGSGYTIRVDVLDPAEEHLANSWSALAGHAVTPGPSARVVEPGPRLPGLDDEASVSGGGRGVGSDEAIVSREAAEKLERLERAGGLDRLLNELTEEGSA